MISVWPILPPSSKNPCSPSSSATISSKASRYGGLGTGTSWIGRIMRG